MGQYTIVTNFLSKDSLTTGNALKAVKGAELTTELTTIQAAVNSKVDGAVQYFPDGTAIQPSVGFTNNAGTGMYNTAGVIGFATGATNRATIGVLGLALNSATGATGSASDLLVNRAGGTANNIQQGANITLFDTTNTTISALQNSGGQTELWQFNGGSWSQIFKVATTRGLSINAPASGVALTVTGVGGAAFGGPAAFIQSCATASQANGLFVAAGTNANDLALSVNNAANNTSLFKVFGDGGVVAGSGTSQGVGTVNAAGFYVNGVALVTGSTIIKAVKTALTARASTTTLSNDPDLVLAIPSAGTYAIEALISAYNTAGGTVGVSYNLNYSGTFTANQSLILAVAGASSFPPAATLITATATTSLAFGNCGAAIGGGQGLIKATLVATGAGTLGFAWAQNASNPTATNIGAGSYITATKIA